VETNQDEVRDIKTTVIILSEQMKQMNKTLERVEATGEKANEIMSSFLVIQERVMNHDKLIDTLSKKIEANEASVKNHMISLIFLFLGGFVSFMYSISIK
jgi:uncharacterized coiled-coil DUF342 family protein